jgi:hypothetical protein
MKDRIMRKKKTPEASRFTVDLGQFYLTDEEVNDIRNQITKAAVEAVRTVKERRGEPYVKITFVKAGHVKSPPKVS